MNARRYALGQWTDSRGRVRLQLDLELVAVDEAAHPLGRRLVVVRMISLQNVYLLFQVCNSIIDKILFYAGRA